MLNDDSEDHDDISSMHSKDFQFGAGGNNRRSRALSGVSGVSGMDSDTSSEMEHISDNEEDITAMVRKNAFLKRTGHIWKETKDGESQTELIQIVKMCQVTTVETQTDVASDPLSPSKGQLQEAMKAKKRKLEQERAESLNRLAQIEKRLNKTE